MKNAFVTGQFFCFDNSGTEWLEWAREGNVTFKL